MSVDQPRDKSGTVDAALLIAREESPDAAERRIKSELDAVDGESGEHYQENKQALLGALAQIRKRGGMETK